MDNSTCMSKPDVEGNNYCSIKVPLVFTRTFVKKWILLDLIKIVVYHYIELVVFQTLKGSVDRIQVLLCIVQVQKETNDCILVSMQM